MLRGVFRRPVVPTPTVLNFTDPAARTLALDTAYQASNPAKAAIILVTLDSTANLSLSGGQDHAADVAIGSTAGVASSGGQLVGRYRNSSTGTLTIGLNTNTASRTTYVIFLPAGRYFAIRTVSGSPAIAVSVEQVQS